MKKWILGLIAILLIAGSAYWYYFMKEVVVPSTPDVAPNPPESLRELL